MGRRCGRYGIKVASAAKIKSAAKTISHSLRLLYKVRVMNIVVVVFLYYILCVHGVPVERSTLYGKLLAQC